MTYFTNELLSYDKEKGRFYLNREPKSNSEFYNLSQSIKKLEKCRVEFYKFNTTIVGEMKLSHYAKCLLRYVEQVLHNNVNHKDTCYVRYAYRYVPLGFLGDMDIEQFLKKNMHTSNDVGNLCTNLLNVKNKNALNRLVVNDNWLFMDSSDYFRFRNSIIQRMRTAFKKVFISNKDRIFALIEDIQKNGWSDKQGYNSSSMGVLGYSMSDNTYMVFHGKHRIVALKYLINQGKISPYTSIRFPVIEYNFKHFRQSSYRCFDSCQIREDSRIYE